MASHRARAHFDRARWSLGILLPLWALQLTLAMTTTGLFAWRLGDSVKHHGDGTRNVELAWEAINVAMCSVSACCTLVETAKFVAESLTPKTMLCTHVLKLACALAVLALDVAVHTLRAEKRYSLVGLGLDAALTVTAVALVIYALVTHRRLSAYDDYARPVNFKGYGSHDDDDSLLYSTRFSVQCSADKRLSVASFRPSIRAAASEPRPPEDAEPAASDRGSYSHERDTQFDEYLARRSFQRPGLEAIGAALRGAAGAAQPSSSKASVKTRSRGPSGTSDRVLVAVPEENAESPDGSGEAVSLGIRSNDKPVWRR